MTEGSIIKGITRFAVPCILIQVIQNIYPIIDSMIVGKVLNLDGLAAVGIAGSLYSLFNNTVIGLVSGFAIIASKKFGANNPDEVNKAFSNSLIASVIICILISFFGIVFSQQMFTLLSTPSNLIEYAKEYIFVLFFGFVPNMLYNFLCEMLRAVGNSKLPLFLLIISSVIHLIILYPLTMYFGVSGTALSTVISYLITVALGYIFIYKKIPYFTISPHRIKIGKSILKECFGIGIPMALTSFVVMLGVLILSYVTNGIGTEYIAAYSCASKIGYIITTPIFGFATALAVFTSQNFGAKNYKRINQGINATLKFVMVLNIFIIVFSLIVSKPILNIILEENRVAVNAGRLYLFIRCLSMFILTPAAIYKSVLPAIGKPFFSTLSGFLEIGARFLFPVLFTEILGFAVVPLTDTFSWLMLAIILTISFYYEFKKIQNRGRYIK